MKKYFSILLILFLLLSSCGGSNETQDTNSAEKDLITTEDNEAGNDSSADEECLTDEKISTLTKEIEQLTAELIEKESTNFNSEERVIYTQDDIDILYEQLAALEDSIQGYDQGYICLLYTSPSPRDRLLSRMPSSA